MITLNKDSNTILIYKKLVDVALPELVNVNLYHRDRSLTVTVTVEDNVHFYLVSVADDLTSLPDQITVSFTDTETEVEYYKENAKIK